jgi:endogenous inhibitor of DNA gyrase (YacG/DUF329 family)
LRERPCCVKDPFVRIKCPTCRREAEVEAGFQWRPFCSRRCKIIDLGNWLDEVYRISSPAPDADDDAAEQRDPTMN